MKKIFFGLLPFLVFSCLFSGNTTLKAQSVIVIPFFKEGENKRLIIEEDACYRHAERLIKEEYLIQERFQLIDYLTIVRKMKRDGLLMPPSTTGVVEKMIQQADPDIYILADISNFKEGKEHAIRIGLSAHWTNTGKTLSATSLDSGRRYYDDCYLLTQKAMQNRNRADVPKMEVFIQMMKEMMPGDEVQPVQPISILFTNKSEDYNYMNKLNNGKRLYKVIQNWIKAHTVNKKSGGSSSPDLIKFDELLIPVRIEDGDEVSPMDFGSDLLDYLEEFTFEDEDITPSFDFNVIGKTINYTLE